MNRVTIRGMKLAAVVLLAACGAAPTPAPPPQRPTEDAPALAALRAAEFPQALSERDRAFCALDARTYIAVQSTHGASASPPVT